MQRNFFLIILIFYSLSFCIEISVKGYVPDDLNVSSAVDQYDRICKLLQISDFADSSSVTVIFYKKSQNAFLGLRLPEWGGGGALGNDSIFIPVDVSYVFFQSDFNRILTHELVHIIINRSYGLIRIPRWFHEGVAMALSGEIDYNAQITLSRAIITGKLMSLSSVNNVNRFNRDNANLAYSQSHFAVQFLFQKYGYDMLPELLSEIKQRNSFEQACFSVFGLTSIEIDSIIRKEIEDKYRLVFIFDETFFWFLILFLAVIGFFVTMHRKKTVIKEMELKEAETENENND